MLKFGSKYQFNLNWLIIYIGISSAIVNPALVFAPIFVGGMVTALGFSTSNAIVIISAELVASAISFIPALWWANRISWRKVAALSLVVITIGNLLSIGSDQFVVLLVIRIFTGLFEGNLLILFMLIAAQVAKTEELFGGKLALQMLTVVVGLALLPLAVSAWGLSGMYAALAVSSGVLMLGIKLLPNLKKSEVPILLQNKKIKPTFWACISLLLLLMFAAGINTIWVYLERIGAANSISFDVIGVLLAGAILLSVICGLICSSIGVRYGRILPISVGLLAGVMGCLFLIAEEVAVYIYTIGVLLIAIAKVLPLPYLFGYLVLLDRQQHFTVLSHVVLALGMALGPILTLLFLQEIGYQSILVFAITMLTLTCLLSLKLMYVVKRAQR